MRRFDKAPARHWRIPLIIVTCAVWIGCSGESGDHLSIVESVDWYEQNSIALEGRVAYSHWQSQSPVADVLLLSPDVAVVGESSTSIVIVFDPADDTPGKSVVEYGIGPGELDGIGSISRASDGFAVAGGGGRRVLIFDAHSQLLLTTSTSGSYQDISAVGSGFVAVPFVPHRRDTLLSFFENSDERVLVPVDHTPYPDMRSLSLPEAFPDAMHSWRVATSNGTAYLAGVGFPAVAAVDTSNPGKPTVYRFQDDFASKTRDLKSQWSSGSFPYFFEDIDVDEHGLVFLARSGGWGEHPSGGGAFRVDVLDNSLSPVASLLVQNHPDRISVHGGALLVGSHVSLFGEERLQIYDYRQVLSRMYELGIDREVRWILGQ
jgi:hypothetical protein